MYKSIMANNEEITLYSPPETRARAIVGYCRELGFPPGNVIISGSVLQISGSLDRITKLFVILQNDSLIDINTKSLAIRAIQEAKVTGMSATTIKVHLEPLVEQAIKYNDLQIIKFDNQWCVIKQKDIQRLGFDKEQTYFQLLTKEVKRILADSPEKARIYSNKELIKEFILKPLLLKHHITADKLTAQKLQGWIKAISFILDDIKNKFNLDSLVYTPARGGVIKIRDNAGKEYEPFFQNNEFESWVPVTF